jgi:ribosomal protein S21
MINTKNYGPPEFDFNRIRPIEVVVEGSSREDFEHAVRKFKALFQKERIVGQLKEKMSYEKPSARKRRKTREAIERRFQNDMKEKMIKTGEWDRRQKRKVNSKIQKDERRSEVIDE